MSVHRMKAIADVFQVNFLPVNLVPGFPFNYEVKIRFGKKRTAYAI